jgi:hypothetical protein
MTQQLDNTTAEESSSALNLHEMSPTEQEAVLGEMAGLALEAALGRLLLVLDENEPERLKLELYLETHQNDENMLEYLLSTYPILGDFLEEELHALQAEVVAVMG